MSNETTGSSSLMPDFDVKLPNTSKDKSPFGSEGENRKNRTPTQFWLNVGVEVQNPYYDASAEGSQKTIFISLPLGIALDGIKESLKKIPDEKSTSKPEFRVQMIGQHQLVASMEEAMKKCTEGQRVLLTDKLRVELYHVKKGETLATVDPTKNPLTDFKLF